MLRDEVLQMATITGNELEEEVERFLVQRGETILENTKVCILREQECSGNFCRDCPSFIGCKKKYMILVAVMTLPITLWDDSPSAEKMREDTIKAVERILAARTDSELEALVPNI